MSHSSLRPTNAYDQRPDSPRPPAGWPRAADGRVDRASGPIRGLPRRPWRSRTGRRQVGRAWNASISARNSRGRRRRRVQRKRVPEAGGGQGDPPRPPLTRTAVRESGVPEPRAAKHGCPPYPDRTHAEVEPLPGFEEFRAPSSRSASTRLRDAHENVVGRTVLVAIHRRAAPGRPASSPHPVIYPPCSWVVFEIPPGTTLQAAAPRAASPEHARLRSHPIDPDELMRVTRRRGTLGEAHRRVDPMFACRPYQPL